MSRDSHKYYYPVKKKLPKICSDPKNRFHRIWFFMKNAFLQGGIAHGAPFRLVGAIEHVSDRCRKSKVFFVTSIYDDRCYTSKSIEKNFWLPATVFSFVLKFSPIAPGPHSMLAIVFNRLFIAPVPRSMFCMWMFVFKGGHCNFARQHSMGYGGWSKRDTLHMTTLNGVRGMKWKWNVLY